MSDATVLCRFAMYSELDGPLYGYLKFPAPIASLILALEAVMEEKVERSTS